MSEFYTESRNKSRVHTDRYKSCILLQDKETGELLLSTRDVLEVPEHTNDVYHRVASHEVDRLDLISEMYYRNPLLWWVIAQANDIVDPFIPVEVGTLLRIPDIETLYGNKGILL